MIRWRYVLPRVLLLVVVVGGVRLSLDPAIRWFLTRSGQAMTGARVEIAKLHVDPLRMSVQMEQIRVADPDSPMKNVFQAEQLRMHLETAAALRKKLVVREGSVSGIVLNTRRNTSGVLDSSPDDVDPNGSGALWNRAADRGEAWMNATAQKLRQDLEEDLQTVQLARELSERWPQEYAQLQDRTRQIEQRGRQIRDQVKQIADRPMDHLEQIQPTLAQIERLRSDLLLARKEVPRLQQQMKDDRTAILRAKEHDQQYVREQLRVIPLDGQELTEYLLGPVWAERVQTAIHWVQWTRQVVPEQPSAEPMEPAERGISVFFPGYHSTPGLLVRKLQLDGAGTAQGNPFTFRGTLVDLASQPRLHRQPVRLRVESQGAIEMLAQATLDRRGEAARDRLLIEVPAMRQAAQVLGNPRRLAVTLNAGTVRVVADLRIVDQDLEGVITVQQKDLQLQPHLSDEYAQFVSGEAMTKALRPIRQLDAAIHLNGKLKRPKWRLQSNLGPQLAGGLQEAVQHELAAHEQQLLELAGRHVEEQLDQVQQKLSQQQREILQQLELGDDQLQHLQRQLLADLRSPDQWMGEGKKLLQRWKR